MTSRDPVVHKAANELVAQLEDRGEHVWILDGKSPYAITSSLVEDEIQFTALLSMKDVIGKKGNLKHLAMKPIKAILNNEGIDKVTVISTNTKTGQTRVASINSKGRTKV